MKQTKRYATPDNKPAKLLAPMARRLMVVCDNCGLLVGWCESPPDRFYCIPCFDHVPPTPLAHVNICNCPECKEKKRNARTSSADE